jgi:hypothetical protein
MDRRPRPYLMSGPGARVRGRCASMTSVSTLDLVGRLEDLRLLLSRLTGELTHARVQAAALRVENRRLREENARLQGRRAHELAVTSLREHADKRARLNRALP